MEDTDVVQDISGFPTLQTSQASLSDLRGFGSASYERQVILDSPVLYWGLGDTSINILDLSGNSRDGLASSTTALRHPPLRRESRGSAKFTGGEYIAPVSQDAGYNVGVTVNWTVEAWLQPDSFSMGAVSGSPVVNWANASSGDVNFGIRIFNSGTQLAGHGWVGGSDPGSPTDTTLLVLGERRHVVVVRDRGKISLYSNARLAGILNLIDPTAVGNPPGAGFEVGGARFFAGSYFYSGYVSDVAVYSKSLSYERIREHWLAGY